MRYLIVWEFFARRSFQEACILNVELLSEGEFQYFQAWVHRVAGINLSPVKKALVAARFYSRLKHYKLTRYSDYFRLIASNEKNAESQVALDLLIDNETCFFREPRHFDFLRKKILPTAKQGKIFRLWSAASSTGEEAFSLAMTLADSLRNISWEIVGSDINSQVLATACSGHYTLERARTIPQAMLARYCLRGTGNEGKNFSIEPSLRERVQFIQINLIETLPDIGEFDVIFLRNVMLHFDRETKRDVVSRVLNLLRPGGYIIVGHSEAISDFGTTLKQVAVSVYQKRLVE